MSDMVAGLWLPDDNLSYVSCRLLFLSTGNYYNKVKVKVSFDNETCTIARVNALRQYFYALEKSTILPVLQFWTSSCGMPNKIVSHFKQYDE
jgi:hypothetical protein